MDDNYKNLLIETIKSFPKYRHKFIFESICKHVHFTEDGNSLFQDSEDFIKVSAANDNLEKLICAIQQNDSTVNHILKTEFYHSYKYSTFVEIKEKNNEINDFITNSEKFIDANYALDNLTTEIKNDYIPSYLKVDSNVHAFKFSLELIGYLPIAESNETRHKYNVILYYFEKENIIEIRWDSIKTHYKSMYPDLYDKIKYDTLEWFKLNVGIEYIPVDLTKTVSSIKESDEHDIIVGAQEMRLKTGSFMTLDIGLNEDAILPFLGELKELIAVEQDIFEANNETKLIKKMLIDLIEDKEETSDLPWITLIWDYHTKSRTKAIEIKFSFNHNQDIFDVLMYHGTKPEFGRMNDVTRFLIENRTKVLSFELE